MSKSKLDFLIPLMCFFLGILFFSSLFYTFKWLIINPVEVERDASGFYSKKWEVCIHYGRWGNTVYVDDYSVFLNREFTWEDRYFVNPTIVIEKNNNYEVKNEDKNNLPKK